MVGLISVPSLTSDGAEAEGAAGAAGAGGAGGPGACSTAASGTCAESELDVSAEAGRGGGEARRAGAPPTEHIIHTFIYQVTPLLDSYNLTLLISLPHLSQTLARASSS